MVPTTGLHRARSAATKTTLTMTEAAETRDASRFITNRTVLPTTVVTTRDSTVMMTAATAQVTVTEEVEAENTTSQTDSATGVGHHIAMAGMVPQVRTAADQIHAGTIVIDSEIVVPTAVPATADMLKTCPGADAQASTQGRVPHHLLAEKISGLNIAMLQRRKIL